MAATGKIHFVGSRLMADRAHPDALIRTAGLSRLPRDLLKVPIARDVLTEHLAFYLLRTARRPARPAPMASAHFSAARYLPAAADSTSIASTARVTLVLYKYTVKEKRESFIIPLGKIGDLNLVKSFMF